MNVLLNYVFRRIWSNKTNFLINLLGLSIGMIAFLFIAVWIISEKSYDRFWEGADNMYRVELQRSAAGNDLTNTARNFNGVGPVLRNELPEIEAATHLDKDIITVFTPTASVQNINMFFTDSSFFKVFPRPLRSDNPRQIFGDIHNAIISRSLGQKLFGTEDPLGQSFKLNEGWEFNIVAVFDDVPENSHIKFGLILQRKALLYYMRNFDYTTGVLDNSRLSSFTEADPYSESQWKGTRGYTYLRLKEGSSIQQVEQKYAGAIAPCIGQFVANSETIQFSFKAVPDIHLAESKEGEMFANGSRMRLWAFALIGFLLLITSLLNYANIAVASSMSQVQSRGIHRVLGANRRVFYLTVLLEAFVFNLIAGLISFLPAVICLRHGCVIAGFEFFPTTLATIFTILPGLIVAGTLLGSIYPFLFMERRLVQANSSLKVTAKGGGVRSTRALVVFQFAVSIFLIIGTIAIFKQLQFMEESSTGMNMEQTMVSFSPMTMIKKPDEWTKLETFRSEVQKIPGVKAFTTAEIIAGSDYHRSSERVWLQDAEESKFPFAIAHVDYNYFDFFAMQSVAGSLFNVESKRDGSEVILNESACRQLGLAPTEAVDRYLQVDGTPRRIVAVVTDHHQLSLREAIKPALFFNSLNWNRTVGYYFIKIAPTGQTATISAVSDLWRKLYPQEEYHFSFLDENYQAAYQADVNFGRIYLLLALLTIFIASMGLYALARFASKVRIKEIGIRKVNGAKISEILLMLNNDFIRWVVIAFVIAMPVAWYAMNKWLEKFAYKTELSWWIFALAGLLALGIALLTVSWQSWKAATRNPVEALRYE